ncbi:MAG: HAD hydrolase-like protein [Sphaerochaeta sp.]|jgi:phosphoglycolate phosphatase|uniref:HAD hydrolase-like protein n=1 Tax=Sphaerochaeta sp. S2 TaxID=2798868 RepID=UPI0018E95068|nr:HAD hydrolase-like protein [Sphaerochaeta sp. S2]MCK9349464.1 HAD hydrolase-like protein [Sphaerochaeta sp.]MBJ2357365.1 HAD hydrolase-like protein [Sphaerochaeta sp. S2]MDD4301774.1 HAD hydrolase-like protein [Sphaerochaeta sp.]MDD4647443.1 HAD hydrolase-like protein [Sphaerochaeta sp.]MDY0244134.1 HAD hydrolase-like protein [Sphaerochaeta sp.]
MNFKLAIFDLDGTLMNTSPGIFASANAAIEKLGLPPEHDVNQLSKFIGPPITQCFVKVYNLEPSLIDEAIALYRVEYDTHGRFNAHPYTGIPQLLSTLKKRGYLLAVGTLKYELLAKQMMEHFNLDGYFDSIRGADLDSTLSKADIVNKVLNDLSIDANDAVLIGDTYHDQKGATEAKVPFIAVDWGFGFPKGHMKDETTLAVARSPEELLNLL